jgi:chromosome segregation ATPase
MPTFQYIKTELQLSRALKHLRNLEMRRNRLDDQIASADDIVKSLTEQLTELESKGEANRW